MLPATFSAPHAAPTPYAPDGRQAVLPGVPFTASATVSSSGGALTLRVTVRRERLARALGGPVDVERAFALVPRYEGRELSWHKRALDAVGHKRTHEGRVDEHARVLEVEDPRALRDYGLALGLDTDRGVLWLQDFDENFKA